MAILDPELVAGRPGRLTVATGFEAYCARGCHALADGIAIERLRLCAKWLPAVAESVSHVEGSGHMMAAAAMGVAEFQKGLGAVHSLSHTAGAAHDTRHGLTNATLLLYVAAYNRPVIEDKVGAPSQAAGLEESTFEAMLEWMLDLRRDPGVSHALLEFCVGNVRLDELARVAAADPTAASNPRAAGEEGMFSMLRASMDGALRAI